VVPIYLSAIGYVHGERRSLAEISEEMPVDLRQPKHGLAHYRQSAQEIWELAGTAAERTLATSRRRPRPILYVSEDDPQVPVSLARIARRLDLISAAALSLAGHDCGNLGPALLTAGDALSAGRYERVLLILADRPLPGTRVMRNGMSIFSDGAAACLVTRDEPDRDGPGFAVDAVHTVTRFASVEPDQAMLAKVELAAECVAEITAQADVPIEAYQHVILNNYRISAQRFLAAAMGFTRHRLLPGEVADLGHCSGDLLVTLHQQASSGALAAGDRVMAAATGPHSWSLISLCRT
jgi:3-oxoacyl-[acyl-carrier-protein] synthase-3